MKIRRETLLTIGLLLLLAVLTVASALSGRETETAIPLDSASTAPNGAAALYNWLDAIGYTVGDSVSPVFEIPADVDLVFLLEPQRLTMQEMDAIEDWVSAGGTLVFAGELFSSAPLLDRFDAQRAYADEPGETLPVPLAVLINPPVVSDLPFSPTSHFDIDRLDYVPLAASAEGPVIVRIEQGEGHVFLSALTDPFTNAGLKEPAAAAFVLNLVRTIPDGGAIWFDEWHHGRREIVSGPAGPGDWLRRTPSGHALLFTAAAVFAWIALSGRAFGRPVEPANRRERRAPIEYVNAIAGLNQRAGNRSALLMHYHRQIKRRLAGRYRIDPNLADEAFLAEIANFDPNLDLSRLGSLLEALLSPGAGEADMVRLSAEAVEWLETGPGKEHTP